MVVGFQQEISEDFRFARASVLGEKQRCCEENPQIICLQGWSLSLHLSAVEPEIGGKTIFLE